MDMRRYFVLAVALMLAAACGSASGGAASSPSPTPSSGLGYDVTSTNSDHAVSMHIGQKLEVVLRAGPGMNDWTHPVSSDTSALAPIVDQAATAAIGVTLAAFQAMKPGQVEVTSTGSPKCSPGQACPQYLALYRLTVTITQ